MEVNSRRNRIDASLIPWGERPYRFPPAFGRPGSPVDLFGIWYVQFSPSLQIPSLDCLLVVLLDTVHRWRFEQEETRSVEGSDHSASDFNG